MAPMPRSTLTAALAALLLLLPACGAAPGRSDARHGQRGLVVRSDWRELGPLAFERYVEETLPAGRVTELSDAALTELTAALEPQDAGSVRAAVLLARSWTAEAAEALMRRLELRVLGPDRASDAGDVVAAASLARLGGTQYAGRLASLAVGGRPHPDLEVRVECAVSALTRGRDEVIPFLLEILRIETYAGREDDLDFEPPTRTAWVRGRAAEALSRRAGVPCTYSAESSIQDREREARALEDILTGEPSEG